MNSDPPKTSSPSSKSVIIAVIIFVFIGQFAFMLFGSELIHKIQAGDRKNVAITKADPIMKILKAAQVEELCHSDTIEPDQEGVFSSYLNTWMIVRDSLTLTSSLTIAAADQGFSLQPVKNTYMKTTADEAFATSDTPTVLDKVDHMELEINRGTGKFTHPCRYPAISIQMTDDQALVNLSVKVRNDK